MTDPTCSIFRRILPPVGGGGFALDLSPIIAIIVLYIVRAIVVGAIRAVGWPRRLEPARASARSRARWAWALRAGAALVVVALDQITKQIVVATIDEGEPVEIFFGFELANVRNEGSRSACSGGRDRSCCVLTLGALALLLAYFAAARARRPGALGRRRAGQRAARSATWSTACGSAP